MDRTFGPTAASGERWSWGMMPIVSGYGWRNANRLHAKTPIANSHTVDGSGTEMRSNPAALSSRASPRVLEPRTSVYRPSLGAVHAHGAHGPVARKSSGP